MIGLAGGVVSLIGYNYGAKNFDRMRAVTGFAMFGLNGIIYAQSIADVVSVVLVFVMYVVLRNKVIAGGKIK